MKTWKETLNEWAERRAKLLADNESGISITQLAKRENCAERTIATLIKKAKRDRDQASN